MQQNKHINFYFYFFILVKVIDQQERQRNNEEKSNGWANCGYNMMLKFFMFIDV